MNTSVWMIIMVLVLMSPRFVRSQTQCLDVAILVDASGSICDSDPTRTVIGKGKATCTNWQNILDFAKAFVDKLQIGPGLSQVALIRFGNSADVLWYLNTFQTAAELDNAIQTNITYSSLGQKTDTADALDYARTRVFIPQNGDRADVPNLALMITDGIPTVNIDNTVPSAMQLRATGATVVTVGVTNQIDITTLCDIASPPPADNPTQLYCFLEPSFDTLSLILMEVKGALCSSLTTTTTPLVTTADTTTTTVPQSITTTTALTTTTPNGPICGLDVALLVDASGSICDTDPTKVLLGNGHASCTNWQNILSFAKSFVDSVTIGPQFSQVALVRFGNSAIIQWNLNKYSTKEQLGDAILNVAYPALGQRTDTQDALIVTRTDIFTAANGARSAAFKLVLVITDGKSTVNPENTIPAAEQLKATGVTIASVGVTSNIDINELCGISSPPTPSNPSQLNCFQQPDFKSLSDILLTARASGCVQ